MNSLALISFLKLGVLRYLLVAISDQTQIVHIDYILDSQEQEQLKQHLDHHLDLKIDLSQYVDYRQNYFLANSRLTLDLPDRFFEQVQPQVSCEYRLVWVNILSGHQVQKTVILVVDVI